MDTVRLHALVIPTEVVGLEEQEDSASSLPSDGGLLFGSGRTGQQQGRTGSALRSDPHPAFARFARLIEGSVFQQLEPQPLGEEGDSLVIIGHQQGQGAQVL
ncbi:hypothetical protein D3C86_1671590 [compost metagenome]